MPPMVVKRVDEVIMPKFGLITKEEARIKKPIIIKRNKQILKDELQVSLFF